MSLEVTLVVNRKLLGAALSVGAGLTVLTGISGCGTNGDAPQAVVTDAGNDDASSDTGAADGAGVEGGGDGSIGADGTTCPSEIDAYFCSHLGKECGSVTGVDTCGRIRTADCGTCAAPQTCGKNNLCACVTETDQAFCGRLGKDCGTVTGFDNCQASRTVACGMCTSPKVCGADDVCACPNAETNSAFCSRLGKECGSVTAADNCGTSRTVECGSCASYCGADDLCVDPQSCNGLAATCGPSANESCCTSLPVPGGAFNRSYDAVTFMNATHPATVSDFALDKYEVTVGRFRAFVNAGKGTQASPPAAQAGVSAHLTGSGWDTAWNTNLVAADGLPAALKCNTTYQTWTDAAGANENKPMNCVTWYEAFAFCIWDGARLPTEAEWNYAAAGGSEQRVYPWSSPAKATTIDCSYANYHGANGEADYCVAPGTGSVNRVGSESSKGDGKWGHADLAGNVWEWNLDQYQSYASPCSDCATLGTALQVIRGGDFSHNSSNLSVSGRFNYDPVTRDYAVGVRCARNR